MFNVFASGSCCPEGRSLDTTRQCLAFIKHKLQDTTFKIDSELWDVLQRIDRTVFGDDVFSFKHEDSHHATMCEFVLDGQSRFLFDIILLLLLDLRKGCSFLNINSATGYINYVAMVMLGPNCANLGMECREIFYMSLYGLMASIQRMRPTSIYQGSHPRFFNTVSVNPVIGVFDRVLYSGILCSENSGEVLAKMKSVVAPGGLFVSGFSFDDFSGFVVFRRNESGEWARPAFHLINSALFEDCFLPVIHFDDHYENTESALLTDRYNVIVQMRAKSLHSLSFLKIMATMDYVRKLRNMTDVIIWHPNVLHIITDCQLPEIVRQRFKRVIAAMDKLEKSVGARDRFNCLLELITMVEKHDTETRTSCLCYIGLEFVLPPKLPQIWSDWIKVFINFGTLEDQTVQINVFVREFDRLWQQLHRINAPWLYQAPPCLQWRYECTLPLARFLGDAFVIALITESVCSLAALSSSASDETIATMAQDLREAIRSVPDRLKTGDLRSPLQLVFFQIRIQLSVRILDQQLRRVLDEVPIQNLKNLRLLLCHLNKWLQPCYFLIENDFFFLCEHEDEIVDSETLVKQLNIRIEQLPTQVTDVESVTLYMARAFFEDLTHVIWTISSRFLEQRLNDLETDAFYFKTEVLNELLPPNFVKEFLMTSS